MKEKSLLDNKPIPEQILPFSIEDISKMNAVDLLYNCNKEYMDSVAISYSADLSIENLNKQPLEKQITYRELFKNVMKTYHALKRLGVKKGDIISYCSITTPELIYTAYASVLLGSVFDSVDVRFKSEQFIEHFKNEKSKLFFFPKPFANVLLPIYNEIEVKRIILVDFEESLPVVVRCASKLQKVFKKSDLEIPKDKVFMNWKQFISGIKGEDTIPNNDFDKADIISLSHTTGTTGIPKALMHTNENWNAQVYNAAYSGLDIRRGESFFNCTVPWVDFGLIIAIHTFMCLGIEMRLDPLWTPENNALYVIKKKAQWWMGGPGWLDDLFCNDSYKDADLRHIRYLVTGGAPLYPHKHLQYQKRLKEMNSMGRVAPGFGLSEATAAIAIDQYNKEQTMGKMWPLVDAILVVHETGEEICGCDEGELMISSKSDILSQISPGYYKNPEETKETFVEYKGKTWVKTGDRVRKNEDGTYTWISRYKNILTYNGYNINCEKIAERIGKVEQVSKVAIIGCVTEDGNQMPIICVESNLQNHSDLKESILKIMKNEFPDYYKPRDIVIYDSFPMVSMKVDVRKIKADLLNDKGEYI